MLCFQASSGIDETPENCGKQMRLGPRADKTADKRGNAGAVRCSERNPAGEGRIRTTTTTWNLQVADSTFRATPQTPRLPGLLVRPCPTDCSWRSSLTEQVCKGPWRTCIAPSLASSQKNVLRPIS